VSDIHLGLLKELRYETAELLAKVCNPSLQTATAPVGWCQPSSHVEKRLKETLGTVGQFVSLSCLARHQSTLKNTTTEHKDEHGKAGPSDHNIFEFSKWF